MSQENNEKDLYRQRLNIALKASKICVFEVDIPNQLYTFFENSEDIFGVSGDIILKDVKPYSLLSPKDYQEAVSAYFSHPDDFEVIDKAFQCIFRGEATTYEARMRAGGSDYIWCKLDVTPIVENGVTTKMIGVITDISKMKTRNDDLEKEAHLDDFTGLLNKKYAFSQINELLKNYPDQNHALVLIDIDNFKKCNDTLGHEFGDYIINHVAKNLQNCFRKEDVVGRFGGDEFILFIKDIPNQKWLEEKLSEHTSFEVNQYQGSCSLGIALYPQDHSEFAELFRKADKALYHAKLKKATFVFYEE